MKDSATQRTANALVVRQRPAGVFEGLLVGVVVPARDEAPRIAGVIETLPEWVDRVVVIDDGSTDGSGAIALQAIEESRLEGEVITLEGLGVGAAIDAGHRLLVRAWEGREEDWCSVVMAGDGQMDPTDLPTLLMPLVARRADHVKGDRSSHVQGLSRMPIRRRIGSTMLSFWTSLACGRTIRDPQCGFTATSGTVLAAWEWSKGWPGYGYPNHWLMRLTEGRSRVEEVPVRAIYNGAPSSLRIRPFVMTVAPELIAGLHRRGWSWYVLGEEAGIERFPIVFFWGLGLVALLSLEASILAPLPFAIAHLLDRRVVSKSVENRKSTPIKARHLRTRLSRIEQTLMSAESETEKTLGE